MSLSLLISHRVVVTAEDEAQRLRLSLGGCLQAAPRAAGPGFLGQNRMRL